MIQQILRELFGCLFSHHGKWGVPYEETHNSYEEYGTRWSCAPYKRYAQNRTCSLCGSIEKRYV